MPAEPLTPAEAVAIAAVLEAHPTREKHWLRWVEKLRAIANEKPATALAIADGGAAAIAPRQTEIPSHVGIAATLGSRNEAVPQGAETPRGTSRLTSTDATGGISDVTKDTGPEARPS